jgi:hypothetical protein
LPPPRPALEDVGVSERVRSLLFVRESEPWVDVDLRDELDCRDAEATAAEADAGLRSLNASVGVVERAGLGGRPEGGGW